ncbi:uncharacterized protein LOC115722504 isoform X1 [Cannabis sativa]|uniref:uncharacterized protein LOC115722504 isoform X1 n=1 Tax=Cannabis sativa TaxID=3483 RepID=UPI0029CAA992|nr:uncharacterized protein LOC115722504 isoform X1 [Cannabis sativa]XP_060959521.1 uncharacterized protein LOC115722504 isoform X1 [Cannabis sativa]
MYKSKLQELCQKNHWTLPTYTSTKQGLDHNPSFSATVVVNGQSFHTSASSKSSKEAQNDAARVAFNHFSPTDDPLLPPIPNASSFPQPYFLSSSIGAITDVETIHGVGLGQTFQQTPQEDDKTSSSVNPQTIGSTTFLVSQNKFRDVQHVYKSHLQMYTQKNKLIAPSYTSEREGPPHASRFKCRVTVDGKIFESPEFHSTLKEAEHAAAKVALMSLSPDVVQKDDATFHKNLLQELVQRKGLHLPTYSTERFGEPHCPVFVSTVEIEGKRFSGEKEKTKKLAETSAAKAAYIALKEGKSSVGLPILSSSQQVHEAQNLLSPCSKSNVSVNVTTDMRTNLSSTTIPVQAEDQTGQYNKIQIFYVYIPVCIPLEARHEIGVFLKKIGREVRGEFYMVNNNGMFDHVNNNINQQLEVMELGLGREFHISLGRTVFFNHNDSNHFHSLLPMLQHKLNHQTRYWIDFSKWEVFVNDQRTRTFLSLEVTSTGLAEIKKQIEAVNEVYKFHGLPEYYEDPQPHISLAWIMGDYSNFLKKVIQKEWRLFNGGSNKNCIFTSRFNGIACKIGNKTYQICKYEDM